MTEYRSMKTLYICAHDGVYTCSLSSDGALSVTDRLPLDRPMYACLDGGRLFVLLCAPDTPDSEDGSSS